jgi:hypothetical protein
MINCVVLGRSTFLAKYRVAEARNAYTLTDKLFWRKTGGEWHCFQKLAQVRGYVSLCQRRELALVLGQQIGRPEARLRCNVCDRVETELRGWTRGSGPASPRRARSLGR